MTPAEARDLLPALLPDLVSDRDPIDVLLEDLDRAQARQPAPVIPAPRMSLSERLAALTVPPPPMPEQVTP